jgi:peptide-methionine (S)-S-oxide reductase
MTRTLGIALGLAIVAGILAAGQGRSLFQARQEAPRLVPPPAVDVTPGRAEVEVAVLAAGCFWGVQGVYQHTHGVISAVSGYAGGEERTAKYDLVGTGATGHAESVRVTFDPRQISYGQLLQIYFSVAHDPTQLNRQGPDVGPQYRSAIFPTSGEQATVAKSYIAQLDGAAVFPQPIVTSIETDRAFYPAEAYHQDYMTRHPRDPYIMVNDLPKVADLKRLFPKQYRAQPALVRGS